jgi:hypothetical protein
MASAKERSVEGNNGASDTLTSEFPFMARALLRGTTDLLFHRWNTDEVAAKSAAMKSSVAKRTDNTESYLYRNQDGVICIPGEYVRQAIIHSAKYSPDPRSPRKSAMDLVKAGVQVMTALAPIGAAVFNGKLHAAIIEEGRRPGGFFPPREVIMRWAQRRLGLSEPEARRAAWPIARAIQRRGLLPRKVMEGAVPEMVGVVQEEQVRELDAAMQSRSG